MTEIFEREPEYGNSLGRVNLTGYNGTKWREVRIDTSTRSLQTIEYEHHEIHSGSHFYLGSYFSLANAATSTILAVVPNVEKVPHLIFELGGTQGTTFQIYEDAGGSGGTPLSSENNNRASANTSSVVLSANVSITTAGTLFYAQSVGAGRTGGSIQRAKELVLKADTGYLFLFTNQSSSVNLVNYIGEWYEHADKDA